MESPLRISKKSRVLPVMRYSALLRIKKGGFGLEVGWDSFAMMGNPFSALARMVLGSDDKNKHHGEVISECPPTAAPRARKHAAGGSGSPRRCK
jgi:hypothetical protein